MLMRSLRIVCILTTCVCATLAYGGPIQVINDEFSDAQGQETKKLIEAIEAKASELFGVDFAQYDDDAKIELHLQIQDYYNADKRLNDGAFRTNWSFANSLAMEGHIALQPPVPTELLEAAGIPVQMKMMIGQSATHLLRYRAFKNYRSHPDWFTQGLALHLTMDAAHWAGMMGSLEEEPWTSTHIVRLNESLKEYPGIGIEEILEDEDIEDLSTGRAYALRGYFVRWLSEIGVLKHVVGEARRFGGGSNYHQRLNDMTIEAIESAGIEDSDQEFRNWLRDFSPQWEERNRSLQTNGDIWMHGAFNRSNAIAWNAEELGDRDWVLSGSFKIFESEKTQMNILLGRDDSGYLYIAMGPDFGITVFHRQLGKNDDDNKWVRMINKEQRSLELNEWNTFKISKRRDRLMIKINRERPVRVEVGGIDLSGSWGLGAQNKSAGLWKEVQVER